MCKVLVTLWPATIKTRPRGHLDAFCLKSMGDAMDVSKDSADASGSPEAAVPEAAAATTDPMNASTDVADTGLDGDVAKPSADDTAGADGDGGAGTDAASTSEGAPSEIAAVAGAKDPGSSLNEDKEGAENAAAAVPAAATKAGEDESPEAVEAMAAAAIKAALAAAAEGGAGAKEGNGTAEAAEQPKKKRTRRGGWDTPAAPGAAAAVAKKGWGDAPKPVAPAVPMNPLQVRVWYIMALCFAIVAPSQPRA